MTSVGGVTAERMAAQCCSSRCSAERKGFRRELDSWRHKLIHCVGFESILEGIYGPRLVQDLNIFDDCEPEVLDDWTTDARCSFCNLQLDKLSDHLPSVASPVSPPPAETPPPQGLSTSDQLQCQAEQFLNAVFRRKEFSESCDPSIPLAAQDLMRKMIRQFAIEYACRSQSPEGSDVLCCGSTAEPSEGPLDLTVSRNTHCPQQDGVLDLSKKNSSSVSGSQQGSGRRTSEDCLDRSSDFAEGLLSKALKDIRSGSLDVCKAAMLYGIPQKTLRVQTEALAPWQAATVSSSCSAQALPRSRSGSGSRYDPAEPGDFSAALASSHVRRLALQRMACQLRERHADALAHAGPPTPPQSPASATSAQIRIPQVRSGAPPKTPLDLAGLVDAVYQANRGSDTNPHKLKPILPKQGMPERHSGAGGGPESRLLLQADLPPLCLHNKGASVGASVTSRADDCEDCSFERREKQPRKKRGRYRQYDHDILEEAITMVMGGKMSVSKAQGVYGVPHSTLEYKVKERMGTLKTPPKKKPRLAHATTSGTNANASTDAYKRF